MCEIISFPTRHSQVGNGAYRDAMTAVRQANHDSAPDSYECMYFSIKSMVKEYISLQEQFIKHPTATTSSMLSNIESTLRMMTGA